MSTYSTDEVISTFILWLLYLVTSRSSSLAAHLSSAVVECTVQLHVSTKVCRTTSTAVKTTGQSMQLQCSPSNISSVFPVRMAMHTHVVRCYEPVFQSSGVGTVAAVAALAATLSRLHINIHNLLS